MSKSKAWTSGLMKDFVLLCCVGIYVKANILIFIFFPFILLSIIGINKLTAHHRTRAEIHSRGLHPLLYVQLHAGQFRGARREASLLSLLRNQLGPREMCVGAGDGLERSVLCVSWARLEFPGPQTLIQVLL